VKVQHDQTIKLFSTNAAGLKNGKVRSLRNEVINTKSNIITIQETHFTQKGRFQMNGMVVFEAIRKKKGGGTLMAIKEELKPKLIEEYIEDFELLVVEIEATNKTI
jgi:exonuclease III